MNLKRYLKIKYLFQLFVIMSLTCICSGCGPKPHATALFKGYEGPDKTSMEVSLIQLFNKEKWSDYVDWIKIGDTLVDHDKYGAVTLAPGTYVIEWERDFQISPMIKASGSEERRWSAEVTLEGGHTYTIHADRTIGHGYIIYSWITDDTQSQTIWGREYVPGQYDYLIMKQHTQNQKTYEKREISKDCPEGYYFHADKCFPEEITCPAGYSYDKAKGKCSADN